MSRIARAKRVFNDALELPEGERAAFVERECAGDRALRGEVEALLAVFKEGEAFLGSPTAHDAAPTAEHDPHGSRTVQGASVAERAREIEEREAALRERPGTRIGLYRLLQEIGEGGFGSVFMAEQDKPVQRKVALKIIKLGMDTRQVVARFEQERQALALMDHPHIAKVLDAGATETGRPYFVMELVKGRPITTFCDEQRLSIEDRLSLFAQVCAAVQHAHTKGVIHRDIKPSNVLVSVQDGRPYAKVIDFGIAKATASKLTEKTLFTHHEQIIGTPEYMSPEQAHGTLDIDTRTDVYSLGVLLYELLTGTTPFSGTELKSAAYDEIRRIIREVDPPAPSTRLSKESQTIASVAAMRQSEPKRLNGQVRGELDWIVMKALEKDRQRRYESASGLAADIARFLSGAPVDAAPPSAAYRAKKFVRRHRASVAAGAAVGAALVLGLAAFAWQYRVAADQRDIAVDARVQEAAQRLRAEENGRKAEEEAARALAEAERARKAEASERDRARQLKEVADFQAGMLKEIDTTRAGEELMRDLKSRFGTALSAADVEDAERARRTDAFAQELLNVNATDAAAEIIDRTILKPAIGVIDEEFKDQPLVDATLRGTLAQSYLKLGRFDDAVELQRSAAETRRRILGDTNADTLLSIHDLAVALDHAGRLPDAEKYYREATEGRRATLGENDGATLNSMANLANLLRTLGRFDEAEPMLRHAVEGKRRVFGPADRSTLVAINQLGYLLVERGDLAGTEPLWREAYETGRRVFGDDDRDVLVWRANLGGLLQSQGRLKEAEPLFRESVESFRRVKGEDHPETIRSISALAGHLVKAGRYAEAEPLIRDAVDRSRRVLGPDHEYTIDSVLTLGNTLMLMGKPRDAEPYLREVLASRTRVLGPDHPGVFEARALLAKMLSAQGRLAESEAMYRAVAADYERVLGPDHKDTLIVRVNLGNTLVRARKFDEAEPILRGVVESERRVLGPDHPETIVALANLGSLFEKREQYSEAEIAYRECLERFERVLGPDHPFTLSSLSRVAATIRSQGRGADAEPFYRRAIDGMVKREGKDSARAASARCGLGLALTSQGKYAEAEQELLEAERVLLTSDAGGSTRASIEPLAELYEAWDKAAPGQGYGGKAEEWRRKLPAPDDSSAGIPAGSK